MAKKLLKTYHRFLDEAGDLTFYGKGKKLIIGTEGVSKAFMMGMVKFKQPLDEVRNLVVGLQERILNDEYYQDIPSIGKKVSQKGYYLHATDDIPEIREKFYKLIKSIDCSFEAVVARKIPALFEKKHNCDEQEFYADLLGHLLKNKLQQDRLVLNIAKRAKSTTNRNLKAALNLAIERFKNKNNTDIKPNIVFNVQDQYQEPLLNMADYFCWSIQRVFERGEMRYYNYLSDKISLVIDLYDSSKYEGWRNYYSPQNKLTKSNRIE